MKLSLSVLLVLSGFLGNSVFAAEKVDIDFVGYESEPFYFEAGSHGIKGSVYEVVRLLCDQLNYRCQFRIVQGFRNSLDLIENGRANAGGPFFHSIPRASELYFSPGLFQTAYRFYGMPANSSKISKLSDLKGYSVGVIYPSLTAVSLLSVNEGIGGDIKIIRESSIPTMMRRVENNNYHFLYLNSAAADSWIERNRSDLVKLSLPAESKTYHIVFSRKLMAPKKVEKIMAQLNKIVQGTEFKRISREYKVQAVETEKD